MKEGTMKKKATATAKRSNGFGEWLVSKGLTTEAFARMANVSYNTASKWRRGMTPRVFVRQTLAPRFPDCQLFK